MNEMKFANIQILNKNAVSLFWAQLEIKSTFSNALGRVHVRTCTCPCTCTCPDMSGFKNYILLKFAF